LFLSADTGGGHRASAESLAKQFLINFPGSTYDLLDVWGTDGVWPYRTLVGAYQHLSSHPNQWRALYHLSNSRPWEIAMDLHSNLICGRKIRKRIASYEPDLIVSVHPAMNNVPCRQVKILSKQADKHIPFFTVVTDLASGHCTWFQKNVDKLYLASDRLKRLAKRRGGTPDENIVMTGLPIRNDFGVEAGKLGDRTTAQGKEYQVAVRRELGLDPEKPMVMVMGGGEGVGSLAKIVDELYVSFSKQGVDATICVVCGRNEKLKKSLEERDWASVLAGEHKPKKRYFLFRVLRHRRSRKIQESLDRALAHAEGEGEESTARAGKVDVVGLGFVTRMAEYMVAATVLVSKAGPGTIAEAAAVGLPVMLTSFLPGQEAGNVDYVLDNDFGDFNKDPVVIAEEVACWLKDTDLMDTMSRKARAIGHPDAASDIVIDIGSITHTWKALNGDEVRGMLRLRPNDY
jgi:1,2-diacylglycerol 3-beta-galactosyltransferase